ncbi:MAG: alkaline phosphatase D family protein [Verrucomicrobiota bacterium]
MHRLTFILVLATLAAEAKPPILTPPETPILGELDPYLLQTLYKSKDTDTGLVEIIDEERFNELTSKHDLSLFGGPMLGCVSDTSAKFWVRTPGSAKVQVIAGDRVSETIETKATDDFTGVVALTGLAPQTSYHYEILVNGKPVFAEDLPSFTTYPMKQQPATVSIGFGGCARYNPPREHMWDVIAGHQLDAFLFLGDNVYIDLPEHRTKQRVHYYRRQLRPEFQRFTASTPIYSIYDDHDLGKNDSAGGLHPFEPEWKYLSWKVFRENWNNPAYGGGEQQPGCWFDFSIGDIDFFMLDGRYYRSFENGTMLGPAQLEWLLEKLKQSTATFKVIACGTLWTEHAEKKGRDSWWGVKDEREKIFSLIEEEDIGGVILLSSDRHRSDVYLIERPNAYDLYEFESGKLTNEHTHPTRKEALFSYNEGNFFGMLTFDLTKSDPEVTFQCVTIDDESVYELTLQRSQLEAN